MPGTPRAAAGSPAWLARTPAVRRRRRISVRRALLALLLGLLASGLAVAALRVDGIRVRYALAEAVAEESALRAERAEWVATVRRLRDPARLASLARRHGLSRPERVIELEAEKGR